ncbi:GAF and ANTAR domain-containing protein [Streptomyces sp. NPDC088197]|uniref:GAF and ANTAR domain-containing protein n=1 Tax=unclassified Streptomyces TaxID=2593676 RepID=UPI0033B72D7A
MTRVQRLTEVFVEVADSLTDDFDIIDFLQRLAQRCAELLDIATVGILLVDEHGTLHPLAASDESTRLLELFASQHDQGPCVECFRTGDARIDVDLTAPITRTRWPHFTTRATEAGFVRTHAFPMRLRQRVVGALSLFQRESTPISEEDRLLAQALADIATIAILQQRTLERSQVERVQLQTALTNRIVIEQAKGVLAERWGLSVDDAFGAFRRYARAHHLRLAALAYDVVQGDFDTAAIFREPEGPEGS